MRISDWSSYVCSSDLTKDGLFGDRAGLRHGVRLAPMGLSSLAYGTYERRLARRLDPQRTPHHLGANVDGHRRWGSEASRVGRRVSVGICLGGRRFVTKKIRKQK